MDEAVRARLEHLADDYEAIDCDDAADIRAVLAALDAATRALRDVLEPIEGRWIDDDHRDQDALRIRTLLGLCASAGCEGTREMSPDAEGFCRDCLEE